MGGDTKGRRTVRFRSLSDNDDDFYDEKDDELLAKIADESNMIFDMARELIEGIIDKCCDKDELVENTSNEGVSKKSSPDKEEVINNYSQNLSITNNNIKTKNINNLRFYVSNVRGFFSKKMILEKILYDLDVNICILSETHTLENVSPNINHFRTFRRNRIYREKGGIAVLISNDIARDCVLVWEGIGDNEAIAVQLSGTNPNVIIVANYGTQCNSFGISIPSNNLMEIQAKVTEWMEEGKIVIWAGDENIPIGVEHLPGNDIVINSLGKCLNEFITEKDLFVANSLCEDPTTHQDLKTGKKRALDLVITNAKERVNNFNIDHNFDWTPFSIKFRNGKYDKCFSDHSAVQFDFELGGEWNRLQPIKRPQTWMYNTKNGDVKYEILTNDCVPWLLDVIENTDDLNVVMKKLDDCLKKFKFKSYNVRSFSRKKFEEFMLDDVWRHRIQELQRIQEELEDDKDPVKIHKSKNLLDRANAYEVVSSMVNQETGKEIADLDGIFEEMLNYNLKNMEKNEAVNDDIKQVQEMKDDIVANLFADTSSYPQTIPWDIYFKVVRKILNQKKSVFRDFHYSGSMFKVAIFVLLNRIYIEETIPDSMKMTSLTRLYKKKGDPSKLGSYRFIHNRNWMSKLLEKCLVAIVDDHITMFTPESQIGGIPTYACRDHIMTVTTFMKNQEAKGEPSVLTLVDLKKCFDKVKLSDAIYSVSQTGCDMKALKMIKEYSDEFKIRINGDPDDERYGEVKNSCGQGTQFAPKATGLLIGLATFESIPTEGCAKVGEQIVLPSDFVDDVLIHNEDDQTARSNAESLSDSFDLLSMEVNAEKSAIIVTGGNNEKVKRMRKKLTDDPVKFQHQNIQVKEGDAYLGFYIHQNGFTASVKKTLKLRIKKAWIKTANIRSIINSDMVQQFGWMQAGVVLVKATLPPILSYSSECWLGCPKYIMNEVESAFKKMLYCIFQIPEHTKYSAVLLELDMMRMVHVIHKLQITFMVHVVWEMVGTTVHGCVMEDWRLRGDQSSLAQVDKIASMYGIKKVSEGPTDKGIIKDMVKRFSQAELWKDCAKSSIVVTRPYFGIRDKSYYKWPKMLSQALFGWRTGALKFKSLWRLYNLKRGVGIRCPMSVCDGVDNWNHLINECKFYETKADTNWSTDRELAEYIVKVSRERYRRVKLPLL